ncbi:hypothetical protein HY489_02400 [Candidatus Woesearchaeota archaeon]|nr:hypothetical protein [Candidatus Woesearchaeota archaeon]
MQLFSLQGRVRAAILALGIGLMGCSWGEQLRTLRKDYDDSQAAHTAFVTSSVAFIQSASRTIARLDEEKAALERELATVKITVGYVELRDDEALHRRIMEDYRTAFKREVRPELDAMGKARRETVDFVGTTGLALEEFRRLIGEAAGPPDGRPTGIYQDRVLDGEQSGLIAGLTGRVESIERTDRNERERQLRSWRMFYQNNQAARTLVEELRAYMVDPAHNRDQRAAYLTTWCRRRDTLYREHYRARGREFPGGGPN